MAAMPQIRATNGKAQPHRSSPVATAADARSVAFAKTTRPQLGAIVPRERLFQRIESASAGALVWISGPPGSGKTSLAASYVEVRQRRCLWYQMEAQDAEVANFFHYFAQAALRLDGARIGSLPGYAPEFASRLTAFSRKFFRQALGGTKAPLTVVLDGVGPLPPSCGLLDVLEGVLAQVPAGVIVIVTSRFDAPAAFARYQAAGKLTCIDAATLNVDPDELEQIARLRGLPLTHETALQLHQRTGGWAAGLVLMLEHAKLAGGFADWPLQATPKVVFDFLAGEMFDRFDLKMQHFLLKLACLPRVDARLAERLTGQDKAARLLLNLALNNYFVSETRWQNGHGFQFHPLMRDFLQSRAALDLPEVLELPHLRKAAGLLHEDGHVEDAASLLLQCRDWAALADIAQAQAPSMLAQGRGDTLASWVAALPPDELDARASLLHAWGMSRLAASPRTARRIFERACETYAVRSDRPAQIRCIVGVMSSLISEFDDLAELDRWSARLTQLLAEVAPVMSTQDQSTVQHMLALSALLRPSPTPVAASVDMPLWPLPDWLRAAQSLWRGDSSLALALSLDDGQVSPQSILVCGLAALLSGQSVVARARALDGLALTEQEGLAGHDAFLHALAVAAALGEGDVGFARSRLPWFESNVVRLRRGDRAIVHFLRCWLAQLDEDPAAAQREAQTCVALASEVGMAWLEGLACCSLALLLAKSQDQHGSDAQLRLAESHLPASRCPPARYVLQLARAGVEWNMQREGPALDALGDALRTGREHGIAQLPGWDARDAAELCALALRHDVETGHVRRLVRECKLSAAVAPLRVKAWPWPIRIRTLGRFEIFVHDAAVEFSGKGPGRPAELLKLLIALGGEAVRVFQLSDALWPQVDADYAHKSFTAALHRLRRLLDDDEALQLRDGRLSLHGGMVWTDTAALDNVLTQIESTARTASAPAGSPDPLLDACVQEALDLYRGPFLPDESDQPAFIACREQLRGRLLHCVARVARAREDAGDVDAAADMYLQLLRVDSLFEAPYRHLMLACQRWGDLNAARDTYERLRTVLATRRRIMPSAQTQAVYASLNDPVSPGC